MAHAAFEYGLTNALWRIPPLARRFDRTGGLRAASDASFQLQGPLSPR